MATADTHPPLAENRLLASLPPAAYDRLRPHLEPVSLTLKESLSEPNQPIRFVYFCRTAVASLLVLLDGDAMVEVATVGNEGMVGLPVFLGTDAIPGKASCQIPGEALRLSATMFRRLVRRRGLLHDLLQRYTQALLHQISQSAACNRLHPVEQRCARWLLMTHDRVGGDAFPLTQDFMAMMLGERRAVVNQAAGALQKAGLIAYRRGRITITDRQGLEAAACACYRIVRTEFDRLLSTNTSKR